MATGFIHEREFSRKTFLKGGGALVVGFSFAGLAGTARAADSPFASSGPPDVAQIDTWLTIHADNTATLRSGIVELGQGSATGLLQIAAEELDLDFAQLRWTRHDTNVTPNQGTTSASIGIKVGGLAVRGAAAVAAQTLRNLAATQLGIPAASLTVSKGVVSGGGKSVSYGQLIGDKLFNVSMPASMNMTIANVATGRNTTIGLRPGALPAKPTASYRLVGTSVPRIDIPDKATGRFTYVHNIRVPGMVHGRIVWQRGQGNYGTADQIVSIDESSLKSIPGAQIVRKGNFLGVVAPTEYDAIQAAAQLKVKWAARQAMGGSGNLYGTMRQHEAAGLTTSITAVNTGNVDAALASAAKVVSATYSFPFNGHLPIGPDCCVADVTSSGAVIYSGTQDAYVARQRVATVTGLPQDVIRVVY
jgi:nicotinate dehydrogenase subunit B